MRKRINILSISFAVVLALCAGLCVNAVETKEKDEYVLGVPMGESHEAIRLLEMLEDVLTKKTGYKIRVAALDDELDVDKEDIIPWVKKVVEEESVDFAFIDPYMFIRIREEGIPVHALITYSIDGEPYDQGCIYVLEDSPHKTLSDVIGKKLISVNTNNLDLLSFLLYEGGIMPPYREKHFQFVMGSTTYPENAVENAAYVLHNKLADAAFFKKSDLKLLKMKDSRLAQVRPVACTSPLLNFPIVYREGVPRDVVVKFAKALVKAHKDPAFKEFRMYFLALNMKIVPVKDEDYDSWKKFVELTRKYNWENPEKINL